jgi:hypothetical protein
MASTCCQPPTAIPYKSILNLDFQLSKPPASSDATLLGCAARFNLSPVDTPGLNDCWFQSLSAASQSLLSGCAVDLSEKAEMSESDDDDLPSVREIIARSKQVIDLTFDDNDDSDGDDTIEVSWLRITGIARHSLKLIPPTLIGCIQLAKVTRRRRRRPHNVAHSGHTYWEDIPLEECL